MCCVVVARALYHSRPSSPGWTPARHSAGPDSHMAAMDGPNSDQFASVAQHTAFLERQYHARGAPASSDIRHDYCALSPCNAMNLVMMKDGKHNDTARRRRLDDEQNHTLALVDFIAIAACLSSAQLHFAMPSMTVTPPDASVPWVAPHLVPAPARHTLLEPAYVQLNTMRQSARAQLVPAYAQNDTMLPTDTPKVSIAPAYVQIDTVPLPAEVSIAPAYVQIDTVPAHEAVKLVPGCQPASPGTLRYQGAARSKGSFHPFMGYSLSLSQYLVN